MNAPAQQGLSSSTTLDIQGRRIHFTEAGHGPALLMLHGGGPGASGMSNYSRNVFPLADHFRVIVPDLPGYGASSKGIEPEDPFGDLADSMFGLLDALQIERTHVMGNSLGGACALRMALDSPERIGRLVLMGPGGVGISEGKPTAGLMRLLTYYGGEGPTLEKLRKFIREDLVYDSSAITESLLHERFQASIDPEVLANPPLRAPKDMEGFKRLDFLLDPRLPKVDNRTLVLWGIEDRVNPASGACALQQRMRNCDVYLFSRTGHWVQWERADEFNNIVATFLNAEHAQ